MADYDQYRRMLLVNKHRLDDELEVHADIQERIGSECARLEARSLEAKDKLAREEAALTEELKENDPKMTKDQVEARVVRHRSRIAAFEAYQVARLDHQRWVFLYEAWKARDFAVRKLGDLYRDQYFARDPIMDGRRRQRDTSLDEHRAEHRSNSARGDRDEESVTPRRRITT